MRVWVLIDYVAPEPFKSNAIVEHDREFQIYSRHEILGQHVELLAIPSLDARLGDGGLNGFGKLEFRAICSTEPLRNRPASTHLWWRNTC